MTEAKKQPKKRIQLVDGRYSSNGTFSRSREDHWHGCNGPYCTRSEKFLTMKEKGYM